MMTFRCEECDALLSAEQVAAHICDYEEDHNIVPLAAVPDRIGEVIGWRGWEIGATGGLFSINGTFWPKSDYLRAECTHFGAARRRPAGVKIGTSGHRAPSDSCSCGVYAARSREHLLSLGYNQGGVSNAAFEPRRVIGQVALSGKIVPHEQGFRAEKARPYKVYVPYETWKLAPRIKAMYGIEVELANTFV